MPRIRKKHSEPVNILIGADPELFAVTNIGDTVSLHDVLPGTKHAPLKVPKGAIQVDGIAGEFNIDPARNQREFLGNIQHVQNLMAILLKARKPDLKLVAKPTAWLTKEYMNSLPPTALILGCEPDFNAYTGDVQEKPDDTNLFRTGAGHVHIGWTADADPMSKSHFEMCRDLTKELDFVLFPQSKIWDNDSRRMDLYGKPGSFRPKPYGAEYRVLSNAWLNNLSTQKFVYDACRAVSEQFFKGMTHSKKFGKTPTDDYTGYVEFLKTHHLPYIGDYGYNTTV